MLRGRRICSKTFLKTSQLLICCFLMAVVSPWSIPWYFGGTQRRVTRMHSRFKGFDLILESMLQRLKYIVHSFMSPKLFVWCVPSQQRDEATIIAPSGRRSYSSGQNYHSYHEIQPMYLFIPPLVAWFHVCVDMFLSIIELLCWRIQNLFPERGLLHEALNAINRIAVKETWVIIVAKVVWISQTIVTHVARYPRVNGHHVGH